MTCRFVGHRLILIDAQPVPDCVPAATTALYRCARCGVHQTMILVGTWTISDLLKPENDIRRLERLAAL